MILIALLHAHAIKVRLDLDGPEEVAAPQIADKPFQALPSLGDPRLSVCHFKEHHIDWLTADLRYAVTLIAGGHPGSLHRNPPRRQPGHRHCLAAKRGPGHARAISHELSRPPAVTHAHSTTGQGGTSSLVGRFPHHRPSKLGLLGTYRQNGED